MESFNELQSIWKAQPAVELSQASNEIIEKASLKIRTIKRSHFWTIGMLTTLIFVLSYYYFWLYNDKNSHQIRGLGIMIFVIISRIFLEILSVIKFKKIDFTQSFNNHVAHLLTFYKFRKAIHFVLTPIIYFMYSVGFVSLLPLFKQNLSEGFYLYILISGNGFLLFFSYFLFRIIQKDLNNLAFLKRNF